jgi:hypothetical protein
VVVILSGTLSPSVGGGESVFGDPDKKSGKTHKNPKT